MNLLSKLDKVKTHNRLPLEHTSIGLFQNESHISDYVGYRTICSLQSTFGVTYAIEDKDNDKTIQIKEEIARKRLLQALYGEIQHKLIEAQHLIMSGQYYDAVDVLEEVVGATRGEK